MAWTAHSAAGARGGAQAYSRVALDTGVGAAGPHGLVALLFEGALRSIAVAQGALARGELGAKGAAISRAIEIIEDGLKAAIDDRSGGDLPANLRALYDYMARRLALAGATNSGRELAEVARLLSGLKEAWDAIRPRAAEAP